MYSNFQRAHAGAGARGHFRQREALDLGHQKRLELGLRKLVNGLAEFEACAGSAMQACGGALENLSRQPVRNRYRL